MNKTLYSPDVPGVISNVEDSHTQDGGHITPPLMAPDGVRVNPEMLNTITDGKQFYQYKRRQPGMKISNRENSFRGIEELNQSAHM